MGWSAPTNPKHEDLGEIPGLRELSDEERERLEKNDPNDGLHAVSKNLQKRNERVMGELTIQYPDTLSDIGGFISDWMDEMVAKDIPFSMHTDYFYEDIGKRLAHTGDTYNVADVHDIALRTTFQPPMFYYGIGLDEATSKPYVVITLGETWNETKVLDESDITDYVLPPFLDKSGGSRHELNEEMTPSLARREMIKQGFIENHGIIT